MIRSYQPGDHIAIADIFVAAVHEIASKVYTEEQCLAWSAREPNYAHWEKRCAAKCPFVSVAEERIAGFLELDPDGHIDCAYIHPAYQHRGLMSALVRHALDLSFAKNLPRVYVEASLCAKPMFEKLGFRTLGENWVAIKGVFLLNYKMEKLRPQ